MRIKALRNIGIQTVREFAEKGLVLPQYRENQVVEADSKVAEALFAHGLAEESTAEVTKMEFPGAADQPADSPISEMSRPAAGTGHEGKPADLTQPEPGRQQGSSMTGTGDVKTGSDTKGKPK